MMNLPAERAPRALSTSQKKASIAEPVEPGTSMTYLGGRPLWRYVLWYGFAIVTIFAELNTINAILLPNQVQALEFAHWFTGADAGVNLTALTNLRAAVAGGQVATAEWSGWSLWCCSSSRLSSSCPSSAR
jgi:hypothetical protein